MKSNNFFWISFSDLMVSLFFVMLILFVVAIGYSENQRIKAEKAREASERELKKIEQIQKSVQELDKSYFSYDERYKRYKLNRQIEFAIKSSEIKRSDYNYLLEVGKSLEILIQKLKNQSDLESFDIKYLVIIEGMSSKIAYSRNFELSYERALALYNFWKENNIQFDPEICEVQIAGSGEDGVREFVGTEEEKNQQILIHIIPKIDPLFDS